REELLGDRRASRRPAPLPGAARPPVQGAAAARPVRETRRHDAAIPPPGCAGEEAAGDEEEAQAPARMTRTAAILLLSLALGCGGCSIGRWSKFTYRYGGADCEPGKFLETWCIVEVPEFGYLGIGAGSDATPDKTFITVRLVPRTGVEAGWSSAELPILRLRDGTVHRRRLETATIKGGDPGGQVDGIHLVGYGRMRQDNLTLDGASETWELRLPPVVVGDRTVALAPVQVRESFRLPVPFYYHSH